MFSKEIWRRRAGCVAMDMAMDREARASPFCIGLENAEKAAAAEEPATATAAAATAAATRRHNLHVGRGGRTAAGSRDDAPLVATNLHDGAGSRGVDAGGCERERGSTAGSESRGRKGGDSNDKFLHLILNRITRTRSIIAALHPMARPITVLLSRAIQQQLAYYYFMIHSHFL